MDCNIVTNKIAQTGKTNKNSNIFHVFDEFEHDGASGVNECSTTQPEINMDDDNRK